MPDNMQYIYYAVGVVSIILTIVTTAKHSERQFERRMTRTETLLMLCCKKLEIPVDDINR